ncbi:MAG: DUF2188 domain-containing protein [Marmoricola sp.]
MSTGDVRTRYDGQAWTYEVEGESDLGHRFEHKEPALAGGRFLAQQNEGLHIVEDETGAVREVTSYSPDPADTQDPASDPASDSGVDPRGAGNWTP